ncbi:MAG TPA: DUF1080 domain-containing protein [Mariniphaga anaerophila]|uniref:DUF1080 domain-containing protein n=1 Tax=Mariniphaga anaerophila TaxID=1484053 RepID=A0A831LFM2_9BACT|nr:DUF1080 domain-containing protein [Mariniphaga anaerophila]
MKKTRINTNITFTFIISLFFLLTSYGANQRSQQGSEKSAQTETEEVWIQLFNGKDLNDWQIKFTGYELGYNLNNTFRVEDGLLRVRYDDWEEWGGQFGHIFYKDEFSHYRLRVEYRFVDEQVKGGPGWAFRNNGLMIHGQSAESMELNQDFPVSIEVQLLGGNGTDERPTMNLCTPGTNVVMNGQLIEQHCTNSNSKTYHGDQWVSVEVEVHGGEVIRHFVDGEEVMSYEKPQLDPRDGYFEKLLPEDGDIIITGGTISLQAESHPTDFRKIEVLILDK